MRGRFLFPGTVFAAGAMAVASPSFAASSTDAGAASANSADRFRLACHGAMSADGRAADRDNPAQRIAASGIVDLDTMEVSGFGMGAAPIVVLTPGMIGFGSAGVEELTRVAEQALKKPAAKSGSIVDGSIDRASGATVLVVHRAADPDAILIAMALDCAFEPAPQ